MGSGLREEFMKSSGTLGLTPGQGTQQVFRKWLQEILCSLKQPDYQWQLSVITAVDEAIHNALVHSSRPDAQVQVNYRLFDDKMVITVMNEGQKFDSQRVNYDGPEDLYSSSGRGFLYMDTLMDQVLVRNDMNSTAIVLEKYFQ